MWREVSKRTKKDKYGINSKLRYSDAFKIYELKILYLSYRYFTIVSSKRFYFIYLSNEIQLFWNAMQELRTVQIDDDEMDISDDERDYEKRNKRTRYDSDGLKVNILHY